MYKNLTSLRRLFFVSASAVTLALSSLGVNAQCTNTSSYGSATAPTSGTTTISTCSYQSEYSTINSVVAGNVYSCNISAGGYVTIHQGSPAGPVITHGAPPLQWQATVGGTYYAHWNTNAACGLASTCVTTTITFVAGPPATPPAPVQAGGTPTCSGGTQLTVSGTPGANEVWYWQTSASGTSTANNAASPWTVYANGTYYARAYNTLYGLWSLSSSSVTVSNFPSATAPPAATPGANPACMSTTLSAATPPMGTEYYWQSIMNGSSNSMPATAPMNITSTGTYYLAAYDVASQCWSPTTSTLVTIDTYVPQAPVITTTPVNVCVGSMSAQVAATPAAASGSQVLTFASNYSISASANVNFTQPLNIPVGATITSSTLTFTTLSTQGSTWLSDMHFSLSGAATQGNTYFTGTGGTNTFNYNPTVNPAGGNVNLNFINDWGSSGATVQSITLTVNYTLPAATISWYDAATAGVQLGTGSPFEVVGTSVLPNTNTEGTYMVYAAATSGGCTSTTSPAEINVTPVLAQITPINASCNGGANGSFTLGTVQCGSGNFLYSIDGSSFGPIPTTLTAGTYEVVIEDQVSMDQSAPITLVITEPAMPSALNATNVTYYNATLGWTTTGDETSWTIIYGPAGFDPSNSGTVITGATNPYTITGDLTEDTDYEFYVFSECGPQPDTAGPAAFTTDAGFFTWDTQCGPGFTDISATGAPLGLADDAQTTITTVNPVTVQGVSSNSIIISNNGYISFGGITLNAWNLDLDEEEGNVYWQETTIGSDNYFIVQWDNRPRYPGIVGQSVTFQILFNQTTGEFYYVYDDVVFGGSQSSNDYGAQGVISVSAPTSVTVSSYSNTFLTNNSCAHFYYALCPNITNFSSIIYPDEAILDWNPGLYNEVDWTVVLGAPGFDPSNSAEVIATYNQTTSDVDMTNLTQNTTYDVYIYSECMADSLTSDGYLYTFTTLPFCSNPSAITVADDVDSLEVAWNWVEYTGGAQTYDIQQFNIMYEMDGVYSNEVVAQGTNYADTVYDTNLMGSGVYQVYVQAVCSTGDTSAWSGPITVVMPLSNDTVCGSEMLAMDLVYTFNNVGATVSIDEVNIAPPATGAQTTDGWSTSVLNNTVWYSFIAPPSGSVRINNTAISYNGQLAVYDVMDCADFNNNFLLVAANDNEIDGSSLAPNFTICGLTPGSVYYVMHDGTGPTGNYSISVSEIVLEAGSANPLTQICAGEILDLNTTINGNDVGGAWSAPVASVNASINGSMFNSNGLAYQTFDFQYRMTDGCAYDSIMSQVQIFAPSSAGTDGSVTICKNEPINLFNGLTGIVDMNGTWYDPSQNTTSSDITGSAFPGSFNYSYIAGNGVCADDTSNVVVVVLPSCDYLSIDEAAFEGVQLYPNPTTGIINIDADKVFNVEITDANGRMIKKNVSTTIGTTSIDLGKVQVGVYFVTLKTDEISKVYRVVVQ